MKATPGFLAREDLPGSVDDALYLTLRDVLGTGGALGSTKGATTELLAYQTGMREPTARIVNHAERQLNITVAIARFVWLMAGSDRLEDIAYYEPKVRHYTDDGLSVPGSSYGHRLLQARPGLNQLHGVVSRLKEDAASRQAAAVIWTPEDAVRDSADIPCAFGLFFHVRDGGLTATCAMRSNNGVRLLPFNFFEFSLLAEVVAAEARVPLRSYVHWVASMHVYEGDRELAERILSVGPGESLVMPAVPAESPMAQAEKLARWEARLRHAREVTDIVAMREHAGEDLDPYWLAFFDVLAVHGLEMRGHRALAEDWAALLPPYFGHGVRRHLHGDRPVTLP